MITLQVHEAEAIRMNASIKANHSKPEYRKMNTDLVKVGAPALIKHPRLALWRVSWGLVKVPDGHSYTSVKISHLVENRIVVQKDNDFDRSFDLNTFEEIDPMPSAEGSVLLVDPQQIQQALDEHQVWLSRHHKEIRALKAFERLQGQFGDRPALQGQSEQDLDRLVELTNQLLGP